MMSPEEIKKKAESLQHKSLREILDENKIKLYTKDLSDLNTAEEGKVSWAILRNDDWTYSIFLEKSESDVRRRFTLAHELWHFFLHKDELEKWIIDFQNTPSLFRPTENRGENGMSQLTAQQEHEANLFAAELLMPEKLVKDAWNVTKDIEQLSEIFSVSMQAMTYRLLNLWFISR